MRKIKRLMALFNEIIPDKEKLLQEVELFRKFPATNPVGERAQFLPFFAQHPQLCGFLATMNDSVRAGTQVKSELSLWGDYTSISLSAIWMMRPSFL
jgi:hypothetical protein